jgi:aminoglycoside 6-adenylyltransferase
MEQSVRSEEEMMKLILDFARDRDDVRAVIMTGSRANPAATRDRFQDYDITYLVEDVAPYRRNRHIPVHFGDIMILQNPDDMGDATADPGRYAYLMQFMDGNRIDLTFRPVSDVRAILADSLSLVLLDKDARLELPPPSARAYLPTKPTAKQFGDCCNEFWWLNPYVAKGLYRDQIPYAKAVLDELLRGQLVRMLTWYVALTTNFQVTVGLAGKHLKRHLASELWNLLERTYSNAQAYNIWEALFAMDELFRRTARATASAFGFAYLEREDALVSVFIHQIRDEALS